MWKFACDANGIFSTAPIAVVCRACKFLCVKGAIIIPVHNIVVSLSLRVDGHGAIVMVCLYFDDKVRVLGPGVCGGGFLCGLLWSFNQGR